MRRHAVELVLFVLAAVSFVSLCSDARAMKPSTPLYDCLATDALFCGLIAEAEPAPGGMALLSEDVAGHIPSWYRGTLMCAEQGEPASGSWAGHMAVEPAIADPLEPSTAGLLALGLVVLFAVRRWGMR